MAIDKDKVVIARLVGLTKRNKTKDGVNQSLVWSIRNNMPRLTAYLDNNKMLHVLRGCNSVIESYNNPMWKKRIFGFVRRIPNE